MGRTPLQSEVGETVHYIYQGARLYPFLALGLMFIALQLGVYFKNKKAKLKWTMWSSAVFFGFTTLLWIVLRGDLHSDQWVQAIFD